MKGGTLKLLLLTITLLSSTLVIATPEAGGQVPKPVHWWEIVAGIIAIPAGLLGLYYTYYLAQKVRLETKKLENDLANNERIESSLFRYLPAITPRIQDYVIRFIILELSIRGWSLIAGILSPFIVVASRTLRDLEVFDNSDVLAQLAQATVVTYATSIGYWVLFLFIGVPLLKDISKDLGISLSGLLKREKNG